MAGRSTPTGHCDAFLTANADRDVHKAPHDVRRPPIACLGDGATANDNAIARRLTISLATAQASFDVWAALARLDVLLSDYRRLSARFFFEQLTGEASVAEGNEYRLTVTDRDRLDRIEAACTTLADRDYTGALDGARRMDIRVARAGPWGGETGELVVEALRNHAMAGMASLWVLVHGGDPDDPIRVRLDMLEICRWAWAPDRVAASSGGGDAGLLDWPYLFERLAESIDARPLPADGETGFDVAAPLPELASDARVAESLALHPALSALFGSGI